MNVAEKLANDAITTLASSCTSSATTISVTSAAAFPSTGNFRLNIDSELLLCTAVSGTTFTVVRGVEGSTAASHSGGSSVNQVLTVAAIQTYLSDGVHNYSLPSRPSVGRLLDASGNTITSSDFTIANSVSATIADQGGGLLLTLPPTSPTGYDVYLTTLLRSAPSPTYSVQCAMQYMFTSGQYNCGLYCGLALSDTSGKAISYGFFCPGSTSQTVEYGVTKWTDSTLVDADYNPYVSGWSNTPYVWFKITDDGSNLVFARSGDGVNWVQDFSVSRTDFLSAGPTLIGLTGTLDGTAPADGNSARALVAVAHYSET